MSGEEFKVSVGLVVDSTAKTDLETAIGKIAADPIKVKLDFSDANKKIASIKRELASLGKAVENAGSGKSTGGKSGGGKSGVSGISGKKLQELYDTKGLEAKIKKLEADFTALNNPMAKTEAQVRDVASAYSNLVSVMRNGNATLKEKQAAYNSFDTALKSATNQIRIQNAEQKKYNNTVGATAKEAEKARKEMESLASSKQKFSSQLDSWMTKNVNAPDSIVKQVRQIKDAVSQADKASLGRLQSEFSGLKLKAEQAKAEARELANLSKFRDVRSSYKSGDIVASLRETARLYDSVENKSRSTAASHDKLNALATRFFSLMKDSNATIGQRLSAHNEMVAAQRVLNKELMAQEQIQNRQRAKVQSIRNNYDAGGVVAQQKTFAAQYAAITNKSNGLKAAMQEAKAAYQNYKSVLGDQNSTAKQIESSNNRVAESYKKLANELKVAKISQKAYNEMMADNKFANSKKAFSLSIDKWLHDNSAAASQFGRQIRQLQYELATADRVQFDNLKTQFKQITVEAHRAGKTGLNFTDKLKMQWDRLGAYFGVSGAIMYGINSFRQMYQNVLDVDTAMTELYRVTDLTDSQYSSMYDTMVSSAKEYGAVLSDIINMTANWSRAGFDPTQAAGLAEVTSVYEHIADVDAQTAFENLMTSYKGYEDRLKEVYGDDQVAAVSYIGDILNELDNNYAVTADAIGEGMRRAASSLNIAGNSIQESAAMIGGITEVTQDAEKAGNAMKVVSMRVRGMKGELEELGEETDENVENISKMQGQILNLTHGKVNIFDGNGEFKSTYEIMQGIANVWDDLNTKEQADLLETVAGKHRANDVASLLSNWENVEKMVVSATDATGSAKREHEKYAQSMQGRINSMTTAWQSLSNTIASGDDFGGLFAFFTDILGAAESLIDTLGLIPTVAATVAAALSFKNVGLFKVIEDPKSKGSHRLDTFYGGLLPKEVGANKFSEALINESANVRNAVGQYVNAIASGKMSVQEAYKSYISMLDDNTRRLVRSYDMSNAANMSDKEKEQLATQAGQQKLIDQVALDAQNKSLKNSWSMIKQFNNESLRGGLSQKQFADTVSQSNVVLGRYLQNCVGGSASTKVYTATLIGAKAATIGLQLASMALNMALTMGVGVALSALIGLIDNAVHANEKLAESVDETISKYEEQKEALNEAKTILSETVGDDGEITRYQELAKGVDSLGRNVSLTSDEFAEYIDLTNRIAKSFPDMVQGFDENGNAILSCKNNIEELNSAYDGMVKKNADDLLLNTADIAKNAQNQINDINRVDWWSNVKKYFWTPSDEFGEIEYNALKSLRNSKDIEKALSGLDDEVAFHLRKNLEKAGAKSNSLMTKDWLKDVLVSSPELADSIVRDFESRLDESVEELRTIVESSIDGMWASGDYDGVSDSWRTVISNMIPQMDYDYFVKNGQVDIQKAQNAVRDTINSIRDMGEDGSESLDFYVNMQTKLSNDDCTVGEWHDAWAKTKELVETSGIDKKNLEIIELNLGLDINPIQDQLDDAKKALEKKGVKTEVALDFLNSLKMSELESIPTILGKKSVDIPIDADVDRLHKALDEELEIISAKEYTIDIEAETGSLEALNTALAQSRSATGLTQEQMDKLIERYKDVPSFSSFDQARLFEETATGIRINAEELENLEKRRAEYKAEETEDALKSLKKEYDSLTDQIENAANASDRADLYGEREAIRQKINDLAEEAAMYQGLTSAYNDWQRAEAAGNERDMYSNIFSGMEGVGKELSLGWVDNGTKEYFDLIWGDNWNSAGKSIEDYRKQWDSLNTAIKGSTFSIADFFKTDEQGQLSSEGVFNFFDAVEQVQGDNEWVKRGKDGEYVIDFGVNGDKAVADALGISEELVQIMLQASRDAGFVINIDGALTPLADLQVAAEEAVGVLKSKKLTEFEFNFKANTVEDITPQIDEMYNVIEKFRDPDTGVIDIKAEGYKEAETALSTLIAMREQAEQPAYMELDVNDVDEKLQDSLTNVQKWQDLAQGKAVMTLDGKLDVDTSEIDEEQRKLAEKLEKDKDFKISVGLDENATAEDIQSFLANNQDLEFDLKTNLDVQLGNALDIFKDKMLLDAGIIDQEEFKLRVAAKLEPDRMDEEAEEAARKIKEETEEAFNRSRIEYNPALDLDKNGVVTQAEREIADSMKDMGPLNGEIDFVAECEAKAKLKNDTLDIEDQIKIADPLPLHVTQDVNADANVVNPNQSVDDQINVPDPEPTTVDKEVRVNPIVNMVQSVWSKVREVVNGSKGGAVDANATVNVDPKPTTTELGDGFTGTGLADMKPETLNMGKDFAGKGKVDMTPKTFNMGSNFTGSGSVTLKAKVTGLPSNVTANVSDGPKVNGTAHVNGTASSPASSGRAFRNGSWGTKDSGTALMGELGQETIVRDGRFFTVGDKGAEFVKYQKGDIIFNHRQTEELFKNGYVVSGGGRGKAFAEGTAFSDGSGGGRPSYNSWKPKDPGSKAAAKKSSTKSNKSKTKKDTKDFKETFDWIEIAIDRVERAISRLDIKANSAYRSWSSRNKALSKEIKKVSSEISLQEKAKDRYLKQARSVGLDKNVAKKVREGKIDISTVKDEKLAEKIKEYQEWYEKALDCKDAILELQEKEAELYKQKFDNISTKYDGILGVIEHERSVLETLMDRSENQGYLASTKYYDALKGNEQKNINKLKSQKQEMLNSLAQGMKSGKIKKGTEAWYEMVNAIDEVTLSIEEGTTKMAEYDKAIREIKWNHFDLIQERIGDITKEADFFIDLMSSDKLYDDRGQLTNEGKATMGMHAVNNNVYTEQAKQYAKEIAAIDKELAKDPYNNDLIERKKELVEAQREVVLAAKDEKDAIVDMVKEGIELELDALQELIDKRNEALDSAKDLYDYQKNIAEQTKEIASLEKQMSAYAGDTSEEAKAKIQEIKVALAESKDDLEDSQYDRYVSDQKQLLDELYIEYETILNARLDNIELLMRDMITEVNNSASTISSTIEEQASKNNVALSDSMETILSDKNPMVVYGRDSKDTLTNVKVAVDAIKIFTDMQQKKADNNANNGVKNAGNSTSSGSGQANNNPKKTTTPKPKPASKPKSKRGNGKINVGDKVKYKSGNYYSDSYGKKPYGHQKRGGSVYITKYVPGRAYPIHISTGSKLGSGDLGWLKKSQISGYATGKRFIETDETAWTQEKGREMIVRPSDGAVLTPLAKGDSVLNASASNNIWDMANSPRDFIRDNLSPDKIDAGGNGHSQNTYTQNLENVSFVLPNVKNYDELLSSLQKDKNFERLIMAMTMDRVMGGSSIAKNKALR